MRTIMDLTNDKERVYIMCRTDRCAMQFLLNAEDEGIRFANSQLPTSGSLQDLYCLHKDGTLWYMGMAARMKYHYEMESAFCVDYERYIRGENQYLVK